MAIGPQEVVRSEVEGGLSGPANPIPEQSIDCGCGQLPCPRLAKYATRGLFAGLMSWVGLAQAAAQVYMCITSPTIARRFQIDPNLMEWLLVLSELAPFLLGIAVAYWGDRLHRAAWLGALTMLQAVSYFTLIIPHFTNSVKIVEETENATHTSLYTDDSPELCSAVSSRIIMEESGSSYTTIFLLITVQLHAGAANIAYLALGISYMDDNTKKKRIPAFIGCFLGVKFIGGLLGCLLSWGCLRMDAENLSAVDSYQDQIGAWWLGWPILAPLIGIPGLLLSLFPRRLPSEVVEQAAASLLDLAGESSRNSVKSYGQKVGSIYLFPSLLRLITNKIIVCNVLAAAFTATAVINFFANENIFLESRFHIARPTGMLLGFGDPWTSRLVSNLLKPIVVGLVVIVSGVVIAMTRPRARFLAGYNVVAVVVAAFLILSLIFATCDKPPIVGEHRDTLLLLKYCNRNCGCSKDAQFHPVCDSKGTHTFYNPCYAGCKSTEYVNDEKIYGGCSCVVAENGIGQSDAARDGPCNSTNCRIGWFIFQVGSVLVAALLASGTVGNLLINIRCIHPQDKALVIGFEMTWTALLAYLPGKAVYRKIADFTCQYWGTEGVICHLHHSVKLGDYLCYATVLMLVVAAIFDALVWTFTRSVKVYGYPEEEPEETPAANQSVGLTEVKPLLNEDPASSGVRSSDTTDQSNPAIRKQSAVDSNSDPDYERIRDPSRSEDPEPTNTPLKYGPLGPGNRRNSRFTLSNDAIAEEPARMDSEDDLDSSADDSSTVGITNTNSEILYEPLDLDSDVESDLKSTGPRSRKKVLSRDFDPALNSTGIASFPVAYRNFPNPDDYENLKRPPQFRNIGSLQSADSLSPVNDGPRESDLTSNDGFSKTDSFDFSNKPRSLKDRAVLLKSAPYRLTGDFNEVGIPTVLPEEDENPASPTSPKLKIQSIQRSQSRYQGHSSQEGLHEIPVEEEGREELEYNLEDVVAEPEVPPLPKSPPAHSLASSGFGSLRDVQEKFPVEEKKLVSKSAEILTDDRTRPPPLNTDL